MCKILLNNFITIKELEKEISSKIEKGMKIVYLFFIGNWKLVSRRPFFRICSTSFRFIDKLVLFLYTINFCAEKKTFSAERFEIVLN
ncbi:hypothetical protein BpHYR1_048918, partial [Brachionus plicatilis]